ncbi:MAG: DUF2203 domain-containing protein [Ignavibacteriota bacterium]|jgi:hypothetical protein|nr:MAG: DUF2203 family protein [Chlorobiota bacterium]MBE7475628.1 DUF2203 domain-containing protein [Ignavibacteriales bacterium]MBL1123062.1 DUF2203 family protein [Ignavibacteriota bacterium]MCC7095389.1 DUF2203 domain-containing protein [Ignavibacteriaceae bacterium]MCE7855724.1 DUF2203 family protein [Ignavibacteria bacterium CHB3]MEB2295064.1 DUF2203 domain-containing protein [Ignavibacteria bacterium]
MTTELKYFTPSEAKKTLPLVKKIVQDILDSSKEMRLIADDIGGEVEKDPRIQKLADNIDDFMKELEEIGCYFKDWNFQIGLVDFPSIINGKEVFLCWRSDEDDILYYHEVDTGFAGRKLIPPEELTD